MRPYEASVWYQKGKQEAYSLFLKEFKKMIKSEDFFIKIMREVPRGLHNHLFTISSVGFVTRLFSPELVNWDFFFSRRLRETTKKSDF